MEHQHILQSLAYHAEMQPGKHAIYLLNVNDIHMIDQKITYQDLYLSVQQLAHHLKKTIKPGQRVLLCYPTGLDFVVAFYACLMAKAIAVAVTVPSNIGLMHKLEAINNDCTPSLLLTDNKTKVLFYTSALTTPLVVFETSTNTICAITPTTLPNIAPNDIAFLQYTSGSTATPKGVMISHKNLMDNITKMSLAFEGTKDSIGLKWIPHTHDMGLIGSFLHSVHKGAEIYLMSPLAFIRRPINWLKALSQYKIEITGCPCFGLKICLDYLTPEEIEHLDLSALQYIIVGSEPIDPKVVNQFFDRLAPAQLSKNAFAPAYGLAEATLMVSARTGLKINNNNQVSCGIPYQNIEIVSPKTHQPCDQDEVGEIWLSGASIAQGYWENESATREFFGASINQNSMTFYKTGDLGFLHQGELYITGRLKEMIIIRGMNYYPQDIEQTVLESDNRLKHTTCAVFRWISPDDPTESFVILMRHNKKIGDDIKDELIIQIKKNILKTFQLIPHDIQFINVSLPRTTSGKIQRTMCEDYYRKHCMQTA